MTPAEQRLKSSHPAVTISVWKEPYTLTLEQLRQLSLAQISAIWTVSYPQAEVRLKCVTRLSVRSAAADVHCQVQLQVLLQRHKCMEGMHALLTPHTSATYLGIAAVPKRCRLKHRLINGKLA